MLFLLPTARGIAVPTLLFIAFAVMLVATVRSDVTTWPLLAPDPLPDAEAPPVGAPR